MADLKAYLAEKYMSGPKADAILSRVAPKKKKKKRNVEDTASGTNASSFIKDDDGGWGWDQSKDEEDDLAEAVVAEDRSFKKRKVASADASNWVTIQEGAKKAEEEEPTPADEQPVVVETEDQESFKGGLMTAAKLRQMMPSSRVPQQDTATAEEIAQAQETVYRDASGKRIDTKAEKAAAARAKREREEREARKMEWGKGLVQKEEEEKRKQELEKQRGKAFARHADDKELNEELKAKELWNDPAAAFLTVRSFLCVQPSSPDPVTLFHRKRSPRDLENQNTPVHHHLQTVSVSSQVTAGMVLVRTQLLQGAWFWYLYSRPRS